MPDAEHQQHGHHAGDQAPALRQAAAFFLMDEPAVATLCSSHSMIGAALTRDDGSLATFGALAATSASR